MAIDLTVSVRAGDDIQGGGVQAQVHAGVLNLDIGVVDIPIQPGDFRVFLSTDGDIPLTDGSLVSLALIGEAGAPALEPAGPYPQRGVVGPILILDVGDGQGVGGQAYTLIDLFSHKSFKRRRKSSRSRFTANMSNPSIPRPIT